VSRFLVSYVGMGAPLLPYVVEAAQYNGDTRTFYDGSITQQGMRCGSTPIKFMWLQVGANDRIMRVDNNA
jgi:hypothetical protein